MIESISNATIADVVRQTLEQFRPNHGFTFRSPAITVTGEYCVSQLGDALQELGAQHVMLVTDRNIHQLGLVSGCESAITLAGIELTLFADVNGEPDSKLVRQGYATLQQCQADFILGVGGGSALDCAKAIAVIGDHYGPLSELKVGGVCSRRVGLGAIPTTAGTGSEATDITVIFDQTQKIKVPIKGPALVPDLALLDPTLMSGVPAAITAATGLDALTHAVESYVSIQSNPLSRAYAYHAMQSIFHTLPKVVGYGQDLALRGQMAVASFKAGLAFSNSGLGLTHAIAHQIGARYHLAHGVANAILLPYVMQFNALCCQHEYAHIATALGVSRDAMTERERCQAAIDAIKQLADDLGLPNQLASVGVTVQDLPLLAEQAMQDICLQGNPRQVEQAQIEQLIRQAIGGTHGT
ncbi:iron-containing alcohol dehydrogenase family protein [Ferrimonas lipolytica]|uniref:Iron-containing alcohol dehydrogenase n=1 Tax=Ferrimonas lipolytica TaxID=2724191 RepID=A0A6H1U9H7_9GAMM|nr:iron-containing alcohol dehydrogenase [Ferrimonas lipolytica]QIZ75697.1 iron-containing alcohol dehydrogenase [Ferrimonas lipolytica]